jgi:hypothetical protein
MTDTATTDTEGQAEANGEVKPKRQNQPTYTMTPVDELPEDYKGGRSKMYYELFAKIANTPNQWVEIAHFKTPSGAKAAVKSVESGEREIPQYEGADWELAHRKLPNPDDPRGQKHSKLFARLVVSG